MVHCNEADHKYGARWDIRGKKAKQLARCELEERRAGWDNRHDQSKIRKLLEMASSVLGQPLRQPSTDRRTLIRAGRDVTARIDAKYKKMLRK